MDRTWTIALLGVLAAVGCENMGLDYAGPAEEARHRSPPELVAAVMHTDTASQEKLIVGGRAWTPSGGPQALDEAGLRPVGSSHGQTVYARGWDRPPYDQLFVRLDEETRSGAGLADRAQRNEWQRYLPVVGGDGPVPSTGAAPDDEAPTGTGGGVGH